MSLVDVVASRLEALDIAYCVIGASALAAHGVSRSTQDIDLFTTASKALERSSWQDLPAEVRHELRRGDMLDSLGGLVRFQAPEDTDVDLVVGKFRWQTAIVGRAIPTVIEGRALRVVTAPDLVLLKLHAGGAKDEWDIRQLLVDADAELVAAVDAGLEDLPDDARALWQRLQSEDRR
ncbi:MAG TPA: nucleotidyltransferase [Thermoanaerobaculia bacterium]|nr:nucleotidyltransferase [Thermoanaerobaculia bacterium]